MRVNSWTEAEKKALTAFASRTYARVEDLERDWRAEVGTDRSMGAVLMHLRSLYVAGLCGEWPMKLTVQYNRDRTKAGGGAVRQVKAAKVDGRKQPRAVPPSKVPGWITVSEAAQRLGVRTDAFDRIQRRARKRGVGVIERQINPTTGNGCWGLYLYNEADVERVRAERAARAAAVRPTIELDMPAAAAGGAPLADSTPTLARQIEVLESAVALGAMTRDEMAAKILVLIEKARG